MHENNGIRGNVSAPARAERIIKRGFFVILIISEVSPGFTILLIKLPVKGRRIMPEEISEITISKIIKTATQPIFDQKFL